MKVLVADDNVAIQEILKDILIQDGHIVRIAGTVDDAVSEIGSFGPDAIVLDASIEGEDGLQVLVRAHQADRDADLDTILIKNVSDETPKDNTFIKAVVNKPFKSADISAALLTLRRKCSEEEAENEKKKPKSILSRIRRPKAAPMPETSPDKAETFGSSYIFFEQEPAKCYSFARLFDPSDYSVLVISSKNSKAVRQHLGMDGIDVATLTAGGKSNSLDINALGTLTAHIKQFINEHDNPVIVIDNLTDIIDNNGLNRSLVFTHQLIKGRSDGKMVTIIVSVDNTILTTKDRNFLLGDMSEYEISAE